MRLSDIRSHIAIVPQDPVLFSASVAENIAFSRPDASRDEVIAAAGQAEADSFIAELSQGYETLVGEKGVRLSGGQRQRIAIARAILRNPDILLLDEATSALDSVSEAAVQNALGRLMQGRTSLVIAHRLSTIMDADVILLMAKGQIVATGTHESLIASSALYQQLAAQQFRHSLSFSGMSGLFARARYAGKLPNDGQNIASILAGKIVKLSRDITLLITFQDKA